MFYRRNWIAGIVLILGLAMLVPVAQAQRQDFEIEICNAVTYNAAHFSPEVAIMTYDAKAIIRSTHESRLFDNWTGHGVGVVKMEGGKWSWNACGKRMAPDGEFIIWEMSGDSESGSTAKPIYGTGKWKGVKGESKGRKLTTGKPNVQGTDQNCEKHVGWIELPK
jgi:hypothetical protein